MRTKILEVKGTWQSIKWAALNTIGKEQGTPVDNTYKRRLLLSEHSPIRKLVIAWKWYDLKYWVSVHLVRHKYGIEHWVRTQREDRNPTIYERDMIPQGNLVNHEAEANAQAIINISRKRLCTQASKETKEAWIDFLHELGKHEPELVSVCVPDCIYRGHCYEFNSCGFHKTEVFREGLRKYRAGINELANIQEGK